jgi:hypothetical protein
MLRLKKIQGEKMTNKKAIPTSKPIQTAEFARFYVYALIDPTHNNEPFYIGKGTVLRSLAHMAINQEENQLNNLSEQNEEQENSKNEKIKVLLKRGYKTTDIVRVICRDLQESHALAVESMLIQSVYSQLTNRVSGHHAERFREYGNWNVIPSLDHQRSQYYVYALINPKTKVPFYVGKGTGNRAEQHYEDAKNSKHRTEKLEELRALILDKYKVQDIVRVVAHTGNDEALAYFLESVWMKFILGYTQVANAANAHQGGLIRAKNDWSKRKGFDIETSDQRQILADIFKGLGADKLLDTVTMQLPEYQFSNHFIAGAGELVVDTELTNNKGKRVTLRIQTRTTSSIQVLLIGHNKFQKESLVNHFNSLGNLPIGRADLVHIPEIWKHKKGICFSVDVAVKRAQLLIELFNLKNEGYASEELQQLIAQQRQLAGEATEQSSS